MKKLSLCVLVLAVGQVSFAAPPTLTCYSLKFAPDATNKLVRAIPDKPLMTADILKDGLDNIKYLYSHRLLKDEKGKVLSQPMNSPHSPYNQKEHKGKNNFYALANGNTLVLPKDLSEKNLKAVLPDGIGEWKDSNGTIFGYNTAEDAEGGNHYSFKLECESK